MKYDVTFTVHYEVEAKGHEEAELEAIAQFRAEAPKLNGTNPRTVDINCTAEDGSRRQ
jgi:hypothetical protein